MIPQDQHLVTCLLWSLMVFLAFLVFDDFGILRSLLFCRMSLKLGLSDFFS